MESTYFLLLSVAPATRAADDSVVSDTPSKGCTVGKRCFPPCGSRVGQRVPTLATFFLVMRPFHCSWSASPLRIGAGTHRSRPDLGSNLRGLKDVVCMTSIERTAYPRFTRTPSVKELRTLYTPTPMDIALKGQCVLRSTTRILRPRPTQANRWLRSVPMTRP
jgi:hypothetical protein